jgi:hypothetical protein
MKKFLAALLALTTLLVPILTSCSEQNTDAQQPNNTLKAGNEAVDYYFYYPDDWQLDRNDGMISIRYNTSESNKTERYASISVTSFNLVDQNQGVKEYWEKSYEPSLQATFKDYKIFDDKEIKLDNVVAARKGYTAKLNDESYKFVSVVCNRFGYVYLITLTALEGDYDKTVGALDTVINNFHFV